GHEARAVGARRGVDRGVLVAKHALATPLTRGGAGPAHRPRRRPARAPGEAGPDQLIAGVALAPVRVEEGVVEEAVGLTGRGQPQAARVLAVAGEALSSPQRGHVDDPDPWTVDGAPAVR